MISKLAAVNTNAMSSKLNNLLTYSNFVHAVSGAAGSVIAMSVFYPLETVRTRLQVHVGRQPKHTPMEAMDIVKDEGISSLYQGLFPVLVTLCCSNFVYFYTYNGLKTSLLEEGSKPGPVKDLLMAFVSGVINVLVTNPLWVVNTRIKLQGLKCGTANFKSTPTSGYKGIMDGLWKIISQEGVSSLWNGTSASVMLASNPSIQFMVYETVKRYFQQFFKSKELSGFLYFIIGAISKMVATVATYPLQILQSRFRAGSKKSDDSKKITQSLLNIIRSEGFLGLYRGMEAKLVQTVLTAALMFLCYEKIAAFIFRIMGLQM
ncbi:peroxisomal membrane protein PMP34-like [Ostrea edulis]|uniref:peroxisomal membrane protein PMP34-like n=1 Tax=Ostrea edulis TaxID=37623 RepID=UPI0024AFB9A0|nr:peroxisomal membrane protein PMP34-like [Ostrea edulis]